MSTKRILWGGLVAFIFAVCLSFVLGGCTWHNPRPVGPVEKNMWRFVR